MDLEIFGRKSLDNRRQRIDVDFDELIFVADGREIVVSLYRARIDGRVEIRANDGVLIVCPRAANVVEVESRR